LGEGHHRAARDDAALGQRRPAEQGADPLEQALKEARQIEGRRATHCSLGEPFQALAQRELQRRERHAQAAFHERPFHGS
jgi:hypothetical protein